MTNANKNKLTLGLIAAIFTTLLLSTGDLFAQSKHKNTSAKAMFKRLDSDNNSTLNLDELSAPLLKRAEKRFIRLDTDADGWLSLEEVKAAKNLTDYSEYAEQIVQCVADIKEQTGNEKITVPDPEAFNSIEDKFANLDASGDGLLDLDEVLTAAASKAQNNFTLMNTDASNEISVREYVLFKQSQHATRRAIKSCIDEIDNSDIF
ncbi:hypothetical protein [Paraglaciecola aestuariivivens]